jgi:hypothetical protein
MCFSDEEFYDVMNSTIEYDNDIKNKYSILERSPSISNITTINLPLPCDSLHTFKKETCYGSKSVKRMGIEMSWKMPCNNRECPKMLNQPFYSAKRYCSEKCKDRLFSIIYFILFYFFFFKFIINFQRTKSKTIESKMLFK